MSGLFLFFLLLSCQFDYKIVFVLRHPNKNCLWICLCLLKSVSFSSPLSSALRIVYWKDTWICCIQPYCRHRLCSLLYLGWMCCAIVWGGFHWHISGFSVQTQGGNLELFRLCRICSLPHPYPHPRSKPVYLLLVETTSISLNQQSIWVFDATLGHLRVYSHPW